VKKTKKDNMNGMKFLAEKLVNLYIYHNFIKREDAITQFNHLCHQSEGAQAYKKPNSHAQFIKRFYSWFSKVQKANPSWIVLDRMDAFFEREDYYWEDHIREPSSSIV
jgi:hypothetical protein